MTYGVRYAPEGALEALKRGIAKVESGGNYNALGPEIARKQGTDRAYGKYQVMGANIPQWTSAALGRSMTPLEFLRSPEAQEKVFEHQMLNNLHKYGSLEDAASVWFSGRPLAQARAAGAHDINMPVGDYVNKAMGAAGQPGPLPQVAGGDDELHRRVLERAQQRMQGFMPEGTTPAPTPQVDPLHAKVLERMQQRQAQLPIYEPPKQEPAPTPDWSAGKGFVHGMSLGSLPYIEAAAETGYFPALAEQNRPAYDQRLGEIQQARKTYAEANPAISGVVEAAGSVPTTMMALGPIGGGALKGAELLSGVAPRLAPAITNATRFLSGEAGRPIMQGAQKVQEAMPGLVGSATRGASSVAHGAMTGAAGAAIGNELGPEDMSYGEKVGWGGVGGGILGPLASWLFRAAPGGRFNPEIEENLAKKALAWNKEFPDLNIRAGQVAKGEAHAYDVENMAQGLNEAQVKAFNDYVKEIIKSKVTPEAIDQAKKDTGNLLGNIAAGTSNMMPDAAAHRVFSKLLQEAANEDPALAKQITDALYIIGSEMYSPAGISAKTIQDLFTSGGTIDRRLSGTSNVIKQFYGTQIKQMLGDLFARNNPNRAALWDSLRARYRDLSTLENVVNESGVVSPPAVAKAVKRAGSRTPLARLARAGEYLSPTNARGDLPEVTENLWQKFAHYGMPLSAAVAGPAGYIINDVAPNVLEKLPIFSQVNPLTLGAATSSVLAARMGRNVIGKELLMRPGMNRRLLEGKGQPLKGLRRAATHFGVSYGPERYGRPEGK